MTDYIVDASVVIQHFITDTHTPHVSVKYPICEDKYLRRLEQHKRRAAS